MTAEQLVARPTYAEEFQNIRENVHKVVLSSLAEDWEDCEQKVKAKRSQTVRNLLARPEPPNQESEASTPNLTDNLTSSPVR